MKKLEKSEPLISIVILNYNANQLIIDCISSIFNSNYKNLEIILVDNNSTDGSHIQCKNKFASIKVIENNENLGYCEGNNVGLREVSGDFIVILNPDTVVTPNWIHELLSSFRKYGDGLYQPKLLSTSDKNRINSAGNFIQLFGFGYSRGKGNLDSQTYSESKEIGYASGACLFTSKEILNKIGLFDKFLFAYHDDLELGWRAKQRGIKSFYIPTSIVYHAESFSFSWSKKKFFLLERNRWYCLLTHYSKKTFYKLLPSLLIVEIIVFIFYLSKGMIKEKILGYADIIKNWKIIEQKYKELESMKTISDNELTRKFHDTLEVPHQVSGDLYSTFFNKLLKILSNMSRSVI